MRHGHGHPQAVTWDGTFDPDAFGPAGGTLELRNLRGVVTGRLGEAPLAAETLRVELGGWCRSGAPRPRPTWSSTPPGRWPPPA
jgi:hypothetical protein